MIRIAIVEDEKEYQDTLLSYIKRYREEHFADIATSVFSDGCTWLMIITVALTSCLWISR